MEHGPALARSASVLDRIIAILDAVRESRGSISITELAARTALPKSTVSRLVAAMIQQRYLERTEDGVTLGLRLFELGAHASVPRRLIAAAAPSSKTCGTSRESGWGSGFIRAQTWCRSRPCPVGFRCFRPAPGCARQP